jgi:hypothetical protein
VSVAAAVRRRWGKRVWGCERESACASAVDGVTLLSCGGRAFTGLARVMCVSEEWGHTSAPTVGAYKGRPSPLEHSIHYKNVHGPHKPLSALASNLTRAPERATSGDWRQWLQAAWPLELPTLLGR